MTYDETMKKLEEVEYMLGLSCPHLAPAVTAAISTLRHQAKVIAVLRKHTEILCGDDGSWAYPEEVTKALAQLDEGETRKEPGDE